MSKFKLENTQQFGSIQTNLYSYKEKNNELIDYIKDKVNQPLQNFDDILKNHSSASIDSQTLAKKFRELSTPDNHSVPAFDVKRSTVTEFMAEFLLEKEFQCIFFEKTNKKLNKSIVDVNRHSTGVDVIGIQEDGENLKFVVAEVKASKDSNIPCSSANNLKGDIETALDFNNHRLVREIFSMLSLLNHSPNRFEKYIQFLLTLIEKEGAPDIFIQRLIIFPFLIRNNTKILEDKNLSDFKNFSELDIKGAEIIGIVWAVNKDIDSFANSFYGHD